MHIDYFSLFFDNFETHLHLHTSTFTTKRRRRRRNKNLFKNKRKKIQKKEHNEYITIDRVIRTGKHVFSLFLALKPQFFQRRTLLLWLLISMRNSIIIIIDGIWFSLFFSHSVGLIVYGNTFVVWKRSEENFIVVPYIEEKREEENALSNRTKAENCSLNSNWKWLRCCFSHLSIHIHTNI